MERARAHHLSAARPRLRFPGKKSERAELVGEQLFHYHSPKRKVQHTVLQVVSPGRKRQRDTSITGGGADRLAQPPPFLAGGLALGAGATLAPLTHTNPHHR